MIKKIFLFVFLFFCFSLFAENKVDINNATVEEIKKIEGISPELAERIYRYIIEKCGIKSIYEINEIEGINAKLFNRIKDKIGVNPIKQTKIEYSQQVIRLIQELIDEENLPENVIDYLEDMLLNPVNINRLTYEELIKIPNLSPQDAAAIIKHIRTKGEIQSFRQLRGVQNLSNYGLMTIKKYVDYFDEKESKKDVLTFNIKQKFITNNEYDNSYRFVNRIRVNYSDYQLGLLSEKSSVNLGEIELFKFSVELKNKLFLDKFILGNYKFSQGLGLAIDSTDGRENDFFNKPSDIYSTRQVYRINGLFSDLTTAKEYGLYGAAIEKRIKNFIFNIYYSRDKKDGILNSDGTVNYYYYKPDNKEYHNNFKEEIIGGYAKYYLPFENLIGSYIGIGSLNINYDKEFKPDWTTLFNTQQVTVTDPDYLNSFKGKERKIQSADFQIIYSRFGLFGELAYLLDGGSAHNLGARYDTNRGNLLVLWRNYNSKYDNPYSRGFAESYGRFDGTILSYDYKFKNIDLDGDGVNDYYYISNAQMKSEAGYYVQASQIRINKRFKITNAYYDNWDNYKYDAGTKNTYRTNNDRMQGEIEIQPFMNFAIRLKHKLQRKYRDISESKTNETTIRIINRVSRDSYLNLESRISKNENREGKIDGNYYGADYEYKFSNRLNLKSSFYIWSSNGFQLWNIEDNSIDFMDGKGYKFLLYLTNYINENFQFKITFKAKFTDYQQDTNYTYYYADGSSIRNFANEENLILLKTYLNLRF